MIEVTAFLIAVLTSLSLCLTLTLTKRIHGRFSLDDANGPQKIHDRPVPRICGASLGIAYLCGGWALPQDVSQLWWNVGLAALPALLAGLLEDATKRISARWRLSATLASGSLFVLLTGYHVSHVGIPYVDELLGFWWFSTLITIIGMAGVCNSFNMIDGVNGLASGTALIATIILACLCWMSDDYVLMVVCVTTAGALVGFFLINFPHGRVFLGDGGAYAIGIVLAAVAVMLPIRTPQLSPMIGLLVLAYPIIEALLSIYRRASRDGSHPFKADRLHLHSLVYRSLSLRLANRIGRPNLRNPLTSVVVLVLPLLSGILALLSAHSTLMVVAGFLVIFRSYVLFYRRVALLRDRPRSFAAIRDAG